MKSVLVTGATSGIGRATALRFAQEGYFVYCHGKSEKSDFSVIKEIEEYGVRAKKVFANMVEEKEIRNMFTEIESLEVLVNNAGTVTRTKPITTENFRNTFEINVVALYLCCEIGKQKGVESIVNLGSMRGLQQSATTPDYSASKAAVHNLTASLARMYAPDCRVNAVAPGFTQTGMHTGNEERLKKEAENSLLKMYAQPKDIAEAIYFLASEKSRFITGQVLSIDGGRSFCEA